MKHTTPTRTAIRRLCEGALLLALAEILSFFPLPKMPQGGSVDLAMLPIFMFCARWGFGPGMLVSTAHGVLQAMIEGGIAIGWQSIIGDFLLAYAVLGTAGLFWKMKNSFYLGTLVGCSLRFLVHYVVGATIWAELMPEVFFNMTMTSPWVYSALYNGFLCSVVMVLDLVVLGLMRTNPNLRQKIFARQY